jgi:hypothetical protein
MPFLTLQIRVICPPRLILTAFIVLIFSEGQKLQRSLLRNFLRWQGSAGPFWEFGREPTTPQHNSTKGCISHKAVQQIMNIITCI